MKIDCHERTALLPELGQDGGHFTQGGNEQIMKTLGASDDEIKAIERLSDATAVDSIVLYAQQHGLKDLQPLLPCAPREVWDSWRGDCRKLPHL